MTDTAPKVQAELKVYEVRFTFIKEPMRIRAENMKAARAEAYKTGVIRSIRWLPNAK